MTNEERAKKQEMLWHDAARELPRDGQMVLVASLDGIECPVGDLLSAFGVAVFRKEVTYNEDVEPEYVERRENVFCTDMWDYPDGEVTWWHPFPRLPEEGMKAYSEAVKLRNSMSEEERQELLKKPTTTDNR